MVRIVHLSVLSIQGVGFATGVGVEATVGNKLGAVVGDDVGKELGTEVGLDDGCADC